MQLIIFSGLPGTGKSALAEDAGRALGVPVFAKDWLQASLGASWRAGGSISAEIDDTLGYASYDLLTTLAERQLMLGQSAILDSVATFARIRDQWRTLAQQYGAGWKVVECVCSDVDLHKNRVLGRERAIPDWHELSWPDVAAVAQRYQPWQEPRLVVDSVAPLKENCQRVRAYLGQTMEQSHEPF